MKSFGLLLILSFAVFTLDGLACGSVKKLPVSSLAGKNISQAKTISAPSNHLPGPLLKDVIRGGVMCGKAVNLVKPAYPPEAKKVKASGTVYVEVMIGKNGKVESAKAVSGHHLLTKAAEQAAMVSGFAPTNIKKNPVKVQGIIVYNFVL